MSVYSTRDAGTVVLDFAGRTSLDVRPFFFCVAGYFAMIAFYNEFLAMFPWHVIVAQTVQGKRKEERGIAQITSFATTTINEQECLAVFTDYDLAQKFIENSGINGEIVRLQMPSVAAAVLENVRYSHVAFDSDLSTNRAYFLPLKDVMLQIGTTS